MNPSSNDNLSARPIDRAATSSYESLRAKLLWPFASTQRFLKLVAVGAFVFGSIVGTVLVVNRNAQNISSAAEQLPSPPPPPPVIPSAPVGLSATATSSSAIDLSWDANTDMPIAQYIVYRNGVSAGEITSGTSFHDSALDANTEYRYTVSAVGTFGFESPQSTAVSATTLSGQTADVEAPSIPANLSGVAISSMEVNLTWTASTDNIAVSGYKVYRCSGKNCAPTTEIGTSSTPTYADKDLTPRTAYAYSVKAFDAAGNESSLSTTVKVSTPNNGGGRTRPK